MKILPLPPLPLLHIIPLFPLARLAGVVITLLRYEYMVGVDGVYDKESIIVFLISTAFVWNTVW